jgi:hypothetical protein
VVRISSMHDRHHDAGSCRVGHGGCRKEIAGTQHLIVPTPAHEVQYIPRTCCCVVQGASASSEVNRGMSSRYQCRFAQCSRWSPHKAALTTAAPVLANHALLSSQTIPASPGIGPETLERSQILPGVSADTLSNLCFA